MYLHFSSMHFSPPNSITLKLCCSFNSKMSPKELLLLYILYGTATSNPTRWRLVPFIPSDDQVNQVAEEHHLAHAANYGLKPQNHNHFTMLITHTCSLRPVLASSWVIAIRHYTILVYVHSYGGWLES